MKITGNWLNNPNTQTVLSILESAGYSAYLVGGCVRNALIGAPVSDIDISTSAGPKLVSNLAQSANLKVVETGIEHGTVTVVSGGIPHEITTFRKDIQTDGRHAVVSFSENIEDDAKRRDFTMNALYADARGSVLDPIGGLTDLKARHVRFIGDATKRIQEDYLRILRYFRFVAWYGDPSRGFDEDALAAISANLGGLETLSRERVGQEIRKLLLAPDPAPAIAVMQQIGVLTRILPGADAKALPILIHLEDQVTQAPNFVRRLAILGGQNAADALRLSKSEARDRAALLRGIGEISSDFEAGYRLGNRLGLDCRLLRSAMFETDFSTAQAEQVGMGANAEFPVSAKDLMPKFTGQALGLELKRLENIWIASNFSMSRDALLDS